jgi:hypothetical protein
MQNMHGTKARRICGPGRAVTSTTARNYPNAPNGIDEINLSIAQEMIMDDSAAVCLLPNLSTTGKKSHQEEMWHGTESERTNHNT